MILLSAEETRSFEALVRQRMSLDERALIARAGLAAAGFIERRLGSPSGKRIAVFCGKGNNAADGLALAALLAARGARVEAVLAFEAGRLGAEARAALDQALGAGVTAVPLDGAAAALGRAELAVDALVGTGARLPLGPPLAGLVRLLEDQKVPVLALDLPSGLDPDSGAAPGPCVRAAWTITFLAGKLGLCLGEGPARAGEIALEPLGADPAWAGAQASRYGQESARAALKPRPRGLHKRDAELLVVAGSAEYLGAGILCARAAYRAGAGLVRLALPEPLAPFAQSAMPEAVVAGLPASGALGEMHLEALLALAAQADAAVVGPGLGRRDETLALVRELWARLPMPALFDADALGALRPGAAPGGERVLTPHEGEIRRMLGPQALDRGRAAAARTLAASFSAVALLKGPSTLVATPGGALSVDNEGTPVLATAGTGDVLSGAIGALLAQGLDAWDAARLGAWAHGRSAAAWSRRNGDRGLLATDLAEGLPAALAQAFWQS